MYKENVVFITAHNLISENLMKFCLFQLSRVITADHNMANLDRSSSGGLHGNCFFVCPGYNVQTEPNTYDLGAVKL